MAKEREERRDYREPRRRSGRESDKHGPSARPSEGTGEKPTLVTKRTPPSSSLDRAYNAHEERRGLGTHKSEINSSQNTEE